MIQAVIVMAALASSLLACKAQPPEGVQPQPPPATPTAPSELLKPALEDVQETLNGLRLDKWKRGSIRDEADSNIDTIQRDLKETLPSLLTAADSAPGTISKVLPVTRNTDAIYDVLVHVVEAARVVAPGDQVGLLQQSMNRFEKARVALDEQLQQTAAAQEKQIVDLRSTVQAQAEKLHAAATPPPAPACPAPAPAKKKKKPAAATEPKPATNSTTTTAPATQTKPQ
jgi:uncharacterized membrane protein YccC